MRGFKLRERKKRGLRGEWGEGGEERKRERDYGSVKERDKGRHRETRLL